MNWFLLALASTFFLAGMMVFFRFASPQVDSATGLFYVLVVAAVALLAFLVFSGKPLAVSQNVFLILLAAGLFSAVGNVFLFSSIASSPNPGYADAVAASRIVLLSIASIFLFGSGISLTGVIGVILVFAGVALLGFG